MKASLALHCGSLAIDRSTLNALPTPTPQGPRHVPVHHGTFLQLVTEQLEGEGFTITDEAFGVTKGTERFFGVLDLQSDQLPSAGEYTLALGMRGSHDRSMPRALSIGSHVFVCDNLAFSGEQVMRTKHTTNIMDRLPRLVQDLIRKLTRTAKQQADQLESYQEVFLSDQLADAAILDMVRRDIVPATTVPRVIDAWDNPGHEEFAARNVWRLFNAATEALKPVHGQASVVQLQARTPKLHALCDELTLAA